MSDEYQRLLSATINHLEDLKNRGTHFVTVDASILATLSQRVKFGSTPPPQLQTSSKPRFVPKPERSEKPSPVSVVSVVAVENGGKQTAMEELRKRVMPCVKCAHLASSRETVVFGVGNIESPLMFVGEAPGADEDAQGEPFVGKAGELLTRIIQTMGFSRETVYIANVLKCRPDTPGKTTGNRKPTSDEMKTCLPYLLDQIDIIKPSVIVALGATAVEGLFGKPTLITKLRGNWQTFNGTPVMPTFHPSYLLHNQALSEKRKVWEDMLQVMEKLDAPISEKQRNYFLKA